MNKSVSGRRENQKGCWNGNIILVDTLMVPWLEREAMSFSVPFMRSLESHITEQCNFWVHLWQWFSDVFDSCIGWFFFEFIRVISKGHVAARLSNRISSNRSGHIFGFQANVTWASLWWFQSIFLIRNVATRQSKRATTSRLLAREIIRIVSHGALELQKRFVGIIYRFGSSRRARFHAGRTADTLKIRWPANKRDQKRHPWHIPLQRHRMFRKYLQVSRVFGDQGISDSPL
jgi:hypothetical protein